MTAATAFAILLGKINKISGVVYKFYSITSCELSLYYASGLCCLLTSMSAQSPCGSIGSTDETELDRRTDRRFFLEVNNPATCAGSITSWRVCYYGPNSIASLGSYWATYAVYRRTGSDSFERMSGIYKAIRTIPDFTGMDRVDGEIQQGGFNCYDDLVRPEAGDSPFIIQVGDIIGACVFNPDDQDGVERLQLDVVGDAGGGSEISFLEMNSDGCTMDALPSSVDMADLSNRNNRRVHIHANIGEIGGMLKLMVHCSVMQIMLPADCLR